MSHTESEISPDGMVKQGLRFARDFAAFADGEGICAALLSGLAAGFEGVGLVLLVPLPQTRPSKPAPPAASARRVPPSIEAASRATPRACAVNLDLAKLATSHT